MLAIDDFVKETGIPVIVDPDAEEPYYDGDKDRVVMWPRSRYRRARRYYADVFWFLMKATAAPHRLNRPLGTRRGYIHYAHREAMIVRIGVLGLCIHFGLKHRNEDVFEIFFNLWPFRNKSEEFLKALQAAYAAVQYLFGKR